MASSSPLTPAVFHVLLALSDAKRHGYAIAQQAEEQSDGAVRMGPATLYTTLQRLLDLGWIATASAPPDVDARRRYYRLTGAGRVALESEVRRMEELLRVARGSRSRSATSKP
jgi:DNA-binding PadR family transcriptional regulator